MASTSHASNCVSRPPKTLAEDYTIAADIFVGEVVGCTRGHVPERSGCPGEQYQVRIVEILKDSYPQLGAFSELLGSGSICGVKLAVGTHFLVFTDAAGAVQRSTQSLAGGRATTKSARERRRILSAFRMRTADDLSEPWFFSDFFFSCSLNHRVGQTSLTFGYFYGDATTLPRQFHMSPNWDDDGNHVGDIIRIPEQADQFETEYSGPDFEQPQVVFSVSFNTSASTIENSGVVRVGSRQWPLMTSRSTTHIGGADPIVNAQEVIGGADALEILNAMRDIVDVVISVQSAGYFGPRPPSREDLNTRIKTRTTHLGDKIDAFLACVDGTNRNPTRILDSPVR